MPVERILIAPLRSGLELDKDPWLIMDDAWDVIDNAHVWRGKVHKRFGAYSMNPSKSDIEKQLFSRFRINVGTTAAVTGNFGPFVVPGTVFKIGQIFSIGTTIFTVFQNGAMYTTATATGTYNTATGSVSITGNNENPSTSIFFYPAESVMALPTYNQSNVSDELLYGFDTQFAYHFLKANGWLRLGAGIWTGTNANFYSTTNYRGAASSDFLLFVVNNVVADGIKFWDGAAWTTITPVYETVNNFVIQTARFVIPFKNRLLFLNTTEQTAAGPVVNSVFQNRIRFSQDGDPTAADAFHEKPSGELGGFIEAPVKEAIIAAENIKDRLVVFFEGSTWELVWTNNQVLPFRFQQLNTDLGVESTNSIIPFDKVVLGMGSTGIHACNGMNVVRIDDKIPDEVFDISNANDGPERVAGIKDYWTEEVYWSYSSAEEGVANSDTFPNRVLVSNYKTGSWAVNDDFITAFGYYQNDGALVWADLSEEWQESNDRWDDPSLISLFRNVVAGNQQGFTFVIDAEKNSNSIALSITDISVAANVVTITAIDHSLQTGSFVYFTNINDDDSLEDLNDTIERVESVLSSSTFTIVQAGLAGNYEGGGTITHVSRVDVLSKRYNFFNKIGRKIQVPRIDFLVDKTENGAIQFDFFTSFSDTSLVTDGDLTGANIGTNVLPTTAQSDFEETQEKIWRSLYPLLEGDTIQYSLRLSDEQMVDTNISFSGFKLHAVLFHARQTEDFGF